MFKFDKGDLIFLLFLSKGQNIDKYKNINEISIDIKNKK